MTNHRNLREATKAKYREMADLYRGSPDPKVRGNRKACYKAMYPNASAKVCESQASEIFNHPYVQGYLEERAEQSSKAADLTESRVLREMMALAFYDAGSFYNDNGSLKSLSEMDEQTRRAIIGLDVVNIGSSEEAQGQVIKYKLPDKKGPLELLGKHLRMFVDRSENTNITMSHEEWLDSLK